MGGMIAPSRGRGSGQACARSAACTWFYRRYNYPMSALKVTAIGNSLGVILPKDLVAQLRIRKGDHLHVLVTPRGIELSPYDPLLDEELNAGEAILQRYRSTLRKLAE